MDGLNTHALAGDVAFAIDQEKAGSVVVVGHAFGNFVARQLAADRPDLVKGVVSAAASAGKVPPGSQEKLIGPEMRKAIDGPSDMSLSEEQRLEDLKIAFFAPGHDPKVWLGGWNEKVHHMELYAREHTPVDDYFAAGAAPILDLQAEDDPVAPRRFSGVLKSLLGDRVTIVVIPWRCQPCPVSRAAGGRCGRHRRIRKSSFRTMNKDGRSQSAASDLIVKRRHKSTPPSLTGSED